MLNLISNVFLLSAIVMLFLWIYQVKANDAGIVDAGWAYCLSATAFASMIIIPEGITTRKILVGLLAGFWAFRLGTFLLVERVLKTDQEDGRYRRMRKSMGSYVHPGFFLFFMLQAGFVAIFSAPVLAASMNRSDLSLTDLIGVLTGILAIVGERVCDHQLTQFRKQPPNKNRTCKAGFWRYSRHPNYFFECLHWFAYLFLGIGSDYAAWAYAGPIVIWIFIRYFTGIPHTEKQAMSHRKDYAEYKRSTNMLIPWFPKKQVH